MFGHDGCANICIDGLVFLMTHSEGRFIVDDGVSLPDEDSNGWFFIIGDDCATAPTFGSCFSPFEVSLDEPSYENYMHLWMLLWHQ